MLKIVHIWILICWQCTALTHSKIKIIQTIIFRWWLNIALNYSVPINDTMNAFLRYYNKLMWILFFHWICSFYSSNFKIYNSNSQTTMKKKKKNEISILNDSKIIYNIVTRKPFLQSFLVLLCKYIQLDIVCFFSLLAM